VADFYHVSRAALDPADWPLFSAHYLHGADWKLCCRQLGMDRGTFDRACLRIEETLGRVFRELTPYALFPLDDYFGHVLHSDVDIRPFDPPPCDPRPLRPPMAPMARVA
jgi:hypothetical protein